MYLTQGGGESSNQQRPATILANISKCNHCDENEKTHTAVRVKRFNCSYCDKAFLYSAGRKIHERIHTGEAPYKCNHCDKVFRSAVCRKRHQRIHSSVKPFKCNYCDKAFLAPGRRKIHERMHAGVSPYTGA